MLGGLLLPYRMAFHGVFGVNAVEYIGGLGLAANCRPAVGHTGGTVLRSEIVPRVCQAE